MEPRSADWRQDAPTQPQCSRVWQLDLRIRERFKTPEEYFAFCQRQFESGDQGYTKGGLSSRIYALEAQDKTGAAEVASGLENKSNVPGLGCGGWLLVLALVGWGGVVLYSPHMKADTEDLAKASPAREATASQFAVTMPQADVRLEQLGGFNLEIWISQHDFDSVAYPDRKGFVETVGKTWCGPAPYTLMPSVAIRDVRSGKEVAAYSCVFSYASLD